MPNRRRRRIAADFDAQESIALEGILGWILGSLYGGIGVISLVPILAKGSLRWPLMPGVLLMVLGGVGARILTVSLSRTARHDLLTSSGGREAQGRVVDPRKEYVTITPSSRNRDDSLIGDRGSSSHGRRGNPGLQAGEDVNLGALLPGRPMPFR